MCDFTIISDWSPSREDQTLQGWVEKKQRSNSQITENNPYLE